MEIRWSPAAAHDFLHIIEYIAQENPTAARRIANAIYDGVTSLGSYPHRGRPGRVEGTRELPLSPLPFVVIYRVVQHAVEIANVIHGAQKWPP